MAEPAGWRLSDLLWERLAEAGLAAFDAGALDDAGALWMSALAHAEQFSAHDPRRAATLGNLAAVRQRHGGAADAFCRAALAAWTAAETWVDGMTIAPRARSSLFHLRLEGKHHAAYRRIARGEARKLLHEGRAATLGNLAALRRSAGDDAGAAALEAEAAGAAPRGVKPGPGRWAALAPAAFNDERKLAAAASLLARANRPP